MRLVGNAARRMARRAAKWLCVRGMLKTNRRNRPICFQEVAEYQQDRRPANAAARKGGRGENAAASGGLADGECRYRDAVFFGGTDLPFPRRGGKWPRQGNTAASGRCGRRRGGVGRERNGTRTGNGGRGGETAKRENGETAKRGNGENGNGKGKGV